MSQKSERSKDTYYWYKSHGICVRCQKERAEPGRVMCFGCAKYERQRRKESYQTLSPEQKAASAAYHKAYYQRLKENGICVRCRKNPAKAGRTKCESCLAMDRIRKEKSK